MRTIASRTATAVVGIPILVVLVWAGPAWFAAVVALVAAAAALELTEMARRWGDRPIRSVAIAGAVGLVIGAYFMDSPSSAQARFLPIVSAGAGVSLVWMLWLPKRGTGLSGLMVTTMAALYAGALLFHAPLLRALDEGREWVLLLLLVSFASDTGAFLAGWAIGRRPLAPTVSPSKTWEGAVGGLAGALAVSVAAYYVFGLEARVWEVLVVGALIGTVGQLGDLAVSRLKRTAEVKDSGWLVPGHGGVLDRIDSIVFSLVVVYYFLR